MNFGEIIEPSTRAILYDEEDDSVIERVEWENECLIPDSVDYLLITESSFINKIVQTCLLKSNIAVAFTKKNVINIYKYEDKKYIAICNPGHTTSTGEITQHLIPWLTASKQCYVVQSQPLATYLNKNMQQKDGTILRTLSTNPKMKDKLCPKLEIPNLVTSITAGCFSYCLYASKECSAYIGYIEHAPIDSLNSKPFLDLFAHLGFGSGDKVYKLVDKLPANNLYT